MAQGTIRKQPFEVKDYQFSFAAELETGETITLLSCAAMDRKTGMDVSATLVGATPAPTVSGSSVIFWLEDGTDGGLYSLSIRVESSKGQKLEADLRVFIVEER